MPRAGSWESPSRELKSRDGVSTHASRSETDEDRIGREGVGTLQTARPIERTQRAPRAGPGSRQTRWWPEGLGKGWGANLCFPGRWSSACPSGQWTRGKERAKEAQTSHALFLAVASLEVGFRQAPWGREAAPPPCGECLEGRIVWLVLECTNPHLPNCLKCSVGEPLERPLL